MPPGFLALILHAHLPFVRHPEHEEFLEEDWLFEAITETYLPLLDVLNTLAEEGVRFRLAMSLTPTLGHMLRDPLLRTRYERYLARLLAMAEDEARRANEEMAGVARFYVLRLLRVREWWEKWGDIVWAFGELQERGVIEIIASAATHGFLPLMSTPVAVRAQVVLGVAAYREMFGRAPRGFWLPECAYAPGLDAVLAENGIRWCVLDAHGLTLGRPKPRHAMFAPVFTPAGVAMLGRDRESARQVWSAHEGYPGDASYRDFYRDVGWDAPSDGQRRFTGLKFHRITGAEPKQPYDRAEALCTVERHAEHFLRSRVAQFTRLRAAMDIPPLVVSPFDAELFGHWWFEGPEWLAALLRRCADAPREIRLVTPSEYLAEFDTHEVVAPAASSWGEAGHSGVWLDPSNAWMQSHLHATERRMGEMARTFSKRTPTVIEDRTLSQLARELLLAQASDWPFLIRTGTAREYAEGRAREHLLRFAQLRSALVAGSVETEFLENCEWRDNIFPRLDWRIYA